MYYMPETMSGGPHPTEGGVTSKTEKTVLDPMAESVAAFDEESAEEEDDNKYERQPIRREGEDPAETRLATDVLEEAQEDVEEAKEDERNARTETDRAEAELRFVEMSKEFEEQTESDSVPGSAEQKKEGEVQPSLGNDVLVKTADVAAWTSEAVGKKASGFFKGIEEWGKNLIVKNIGWVKWIPFLGKFLTKDVLPSWTEEEEKKKKEKEASAKKAKGEGDKAKKEATKREADAKKLAEKVENLAKKKSEAENKAEALKEKQRVLELLKMATPKELVHYRYANDTEKEQILKGIEDELEKRREEKKQADFKRLEDQEKRESEKGKGRKKEPETAPTVGSGEVPPVSTP